MFKMNKDAIVDHIKGSSSLQLKSTLQAIHAMQLSTNQETYEIANLIITKYLCQAMTSSTEIKPAELLALDIYREQIPEITDL